MPRSSRSSSASSAGFRQRDFHDVPKKGELQGDVHLDPRFQNVKEDVEDKLQHEIESENLSEHPTHKDRPHRGPTAHKGSGSGGSASKRIHQTENREKARSKGHSAK